MPEANVNLCLALMQADEEQDVIAILDDAGYWDRTVAWRWYGDNEDNWGTIGNQQASPDAALVEKLVNAIDAQLIRRCLEGDIAPDNSEGAPKSIREAVARFFDNSDPKHNPYAGLISEWPDAKRTNVAREITLAATGPTGRRGYPSLTVSDSGEGQTPDMVPRTFMSLHRGNKIRIPFVQGKFNMGGTGVLKFCGKNNLQLVVTRRCPQILPPSAAERDRLWSFTVVRREFPEQGRRSSAYSYLAPVAAEACPRKGGVLTFDRVALPIFPAGREPYSRNSEWGTLIKLYEYEVSQKSMMFLSGGLLERLDLLLPDTALPIRLHECRPYRGKKGSFETTLTGLAVRLADDKANKLEPGFPDTASIRRAGLEMDVSIYAFRKGEAKTYRRNEGIIFTVNGQTHGHLTADFFRRKAAGRLDYLAKSLLLVVDCSQFAGEAREDVFMASRDRLSGGGQRSEIERALETLLREHSGLRALRERRRREEMQSKLEDEKPLQDVLTSILKHSPTLSALFQTGERISQPFKTVQRDEADEDFEGKKYPTYFKFAKVGYGQTLMRNVHEGMRTRIRFETDAANNYFRRAVDKGTLELFFETDAGEALVEDRVVNLRNGIATLNLSLPDGTEAGEALVFRTLTTDSTRIEPFENRFVLTVLPPMPKGGGNGRRKRPPASTSGQKREGPEHIALPKISEVHQEDWEIHDPPFDERTALRIMGTTTNGADDQVVYDFYVNMDNLYYNYEAKHSKLAADLLKARWMYSIVLVGLGVLQHFEGDDNEHREDVDALDLADQLSRAVAPFLLPMIDYLGDLDIETEFDVVGSGEAT